MGEQPVTEVVQAPTYCALLLRLGNRLWLGLRLWLRSLLLLNAHVHNILQNIGC